jgi:hypothetical protein
VGKPWGLEAASGCFSADVFEAISFPCWAMRARSAVSDFLAGLFPLPCFECGMSLSDTFEDDLERDAFGTSGEEDGGAEWNCWLGSPPPPPRPGEMSLLYCRS